MNDGEAYLASWLDELAASMDRFGLTFVQLGAAHRPVREATISFVPTSLTVGSYLSTPAAQLSSERVALIDVESVRDDVEGRSLSALRERIVADMDEGCRFVLLSTAPRIAYRPVPGSSLLEDARFLYGPILPASPTDPASVLPECFENGTQLELVLKQSLQELGVGVCAALDQAMYESMLDPADVLSTLGVREVEALQGAGLVQVILRRPHWSIPKRLGTLKNALGDVLAENTDVQDSVTEIFNALWTLERSLRGAVRARAKVLWPKGWRQQVLMGDMADRVLERASIAAYAAAKSVRELRDPLEWLSLGELLEIRTSKKGIGGLGIESPVWSLLATEVLPIRNRLSHMRLMKPEDLQVALKWMKVVERKLDLSGGVQADPEE